MSEEATKREASDEAAHDVRKLVSILRSDIRRDDKIISVVDFLEKGHLFDFDHTSLGLTQDLFDSLLKFGSVPVVPEEYERDLNESDFDSVAICSSASFRCFDFLLNLRTVPLEKAIIPCLLLCAQHMQNDLWTSADSVSRCRSTFKLLLFKNNVENIVDLLSCAGELRDKVAELLTRLVRPNLSRDNWKRNPGLKVAFGWCLTHLKYPYVELVLTQVLPPSLLFVDDFNLANRLFGIKCLSHIMDNTPKAELQRYGHAQVIHAALKNLIYTRDSSMIVAIYPCLLKVIAIIETDPKKPSAGQKTHRYDVLFETLLHEMDSEQTIDLRAAYSEVLPLLIHTLGITVVKQMKTVIRVIIQYLKVYDNSEEVTRRNCLQALTTLISLSWPRIYHHMPKIMKGLIRVLYDIDKNDFTKKEIKDIVVKDVIECLKLLQQISKRDFNAACGTMLDTTVELPALVPIKSLLDIT